MKNNFKLFVAALVVSTTFAVEVNAQKTPVGQSELPQAANSFLKAHYGAEKVSSIIMDKEIFSVDYEVVLANGVEIEFDKKGQWKEIDAKTQEVHASLLLPETKNYLAKNFPGQKVVKIERGLNLIEVELSSGTDIKFDKKGFFVKID